MGIFLFLGYIIGIGLLVNGFVLMRKKQVILNTPTSKIRSMALGLVELSGKAAPCRHALISPLLKEECVYYSYTVQEKGKNTWVTILDGYSDLPFYLDDGTGMALVDPGRAETDLKASLRGIGGRSKEFFPLLKQFYLERLIPDSVSRLKESDPEKYEKRLEKDFKKATEYFYTEKLIVPGESLYVVGTAAKTADAADPQSYEKNIIITKGANDPAFIISDRREGSVVKRLSWQAPLNLLGGGVLLAACLAISVVWLVAR